MNFKTTQCQSTNLGFFHTCKKNWINKSLFTNINLSKKLWRGKTKSEHNGVQKYERTSKDFVVWSNFRGNTKEQVRGFYSLPVANTHDTHTKSQTSNNVLDKEKLLKKLFVHN